MSYADARLDLTSVNVACLSGSNGAGKSALLDAVTWALWEEGRSSSDELIRLGQREMWVEVNFHLEGQDYRVRRSRQKTAGKGGGRGSSKGTLELQVASGKQAAADNPDVPDRAYTSLTGAHMRQTQERLSELLRMEYQTFVNSVYLKQGKADEFTTRLPSERKQILGDILGLSYFDRLQESAREQARQLKAQAELMEASLQAAGGVDNALERGLQGMEQMNLRLQEAAQKVDFYESSLEELKRRLQEINLAENNCRQGQRQRTDLENDLRSLSQQEESKQHKIQSLQDLFAQSPQIEQAIIEFDQLKARVEKLDRSAMLLQDLNAEQMKLQTEIAQIQSRLEVELAHAKSNLQDCQQKQSKLLQDTAGAEKITQAHKEFKTLLGKESVLSANQEAFVQLNARSESLMSQVVEAKIRLEAECQQKLGQLSDYDQLIQSSGLIDEEQLELQKQASDLDKLEAEFELVEQKGLTLKSEIEAGENKQSELKRLQQVNLDKMAELHQHRDSSVCPLCSATIVDRAAVIAKYEGDNRNLDAELAKLADLLEKKQDELTFMRRQYRDLRQKLEGRKQLDTSIGRFNEKLAALGRARDSQKQLQAEVEKLKQRLDKQDYAQLERESLIAVKAELHKLDFDPVIYANLQAQIRSGRHVEFRYQQLQKDLEQLKTLEAELPRMQESLLELERQLQDKSLGKEFHVQLQKINDEITALGYDRQEHELIKGKLAKLIPSSQLHQDLARARQEQPVLEEELQSCRKQVAAKSEQLAQLDENLVLWQQQLAQLPSISAQIAELEPSLANHRQNKQQLAEQAAVLKSQQTQLLEQKYSLELQKKQLEEVRNRQDDYTYLAEAFGKKGIQAVIIENAIPEIESEANKILSRLSENQMHVALATQHKTKSGNMVETLDLLIGDELGTRNYELYSGGEAFKVDFAVRVALSRLLARRAGAKLETLIIDEGFGSQDEVSRQRLVKAINAIRGDFARILVITHISEVREMFPVQIQVSKSAGESRVQVVY